MRLFQRVVGQPNTYRLRQRYGVELPVLAVSIKYAALFLGDRLMISLVDYASGSLQC